RLLENAIARMLRGDPGVRLRSIAMRPDCQLDVAGLWGVLRINRYTRMNGTARITDIGDYLRIPFEVLEPTFSSLVAAGYAQRDGEAMYLTPAGAQQVDYVYSLLLAWFVDKLAGSPGFEGQPDRDEVRAALERIAHRVLAQRDWQDDELTAVTDSAGP
ncbi:MAG TPA: MFS transporter, partial [Mycobacterium sp.]|nr:MFS transporter [Mycobacterium sp.]